MGKRAMLVANSASMIDHFNRDNIAILKKLGYDITVVANFSDGNSSTNERIDAFEKELIADGVDVVNLPIPRSVKKTPDTLKCVRAIKKYLNDNPCAIMHCQTPFGGFVARLAAKKLQKSGDIKVIYFAHGFHFYKGAPFTNNAIYYNIEKYLSKYTNCLITLNQEDYTSAVERLDAKTVRYVPGIGVDCDAIDKIDIDKKEKLAELGIPTHNKVVLCMAELIPRKNIEQAINIFSKCYNTDCTLLICGKGALLDTLKEQCNTLGISDKVVFAGYRTDILQICKASDIFLFTSRQEGLPVSIMQAMASGLPIVASKIRGNTDLLAESEKESEFQCLVDLEDEDTFVDRLNMLLTNPSLCKEVGITNKMVCREHFDIKHVHKIMEKIYNSMD